MRWSRTASRSPACRVLAVLAVLRPGMALHELVGKSRCRRCRGAGALLAQLHFGSPPEKERRRRQRASVTSLLHDRRRAVPRDDGRPDRRDDHFGDLMTDAHAVIAAILVLLRCTFLTARSRPSSADATDGRRRCSCASPSSVTRSRWRQRVPALVLWRFDRESTLPMIHATVVLGLPARSRRAARLILKRMTPKKTAVSRWNAAASRPA